uniref:Uncharacterized protein n=1 Tax=Zea mays TaxID=4577 RepID=C4J1P8_MAIZE|nr:unknown [Zea mays]
MQTTRRHVGHQLQRLELLRRRTPVEHVPKPAGLDARQRERRQGHGHHALLRRVPDTDHRWLPRQDLEHQHAEAVNVARRPDPARAAVLRVGVPAARRGAGDLHGLGVHAGRAPHRCAEAGQARRPGGVQEDVGGGDVAVDDERHGVAVQVLDGARRANQHLDASPPGRRHRRRRRGRQVVPVQVVVERAVGHVLGEQHALAVVGAGAQEADDAVVAERREDVLLREEGVLRSPPRAVEALDGHLRPVLQEPSLVYLGASVGVVAEHDGEVVGGHGDLRQRELPILSPSRRLIQDNTCITERKRVDLTMDRRR